MPPRMDSVVSDSIAYDLVSLSFTGGWSMVGCELKKCLLLVACCYFLVLAVACWCFLSGLLVLPILGSCCPEQGEGLVQAQESQIVRLKPRSLDNQVIPGM